MVSIIICGLICGWLGWMCHYWFTVSLRRELKATKKELRKQEEIRCEDVKSVLALGQAAGRVAARTATVKGSDHYADNPRLEEELIKSLGSSENDARVVEGGDKAQPGCR